MVKLPLISAHQPLRRDQSSLFEVLNSDGDTRPPHRQHHGQELMRQRKLAVVETIRREQQPAGEAFLDLVAAIFSPLQGAALTPRRTLGHSAARRPQRAAKGAEHPSTQGKRATSERTARTRAGSNSKTATLEDRRRVGCPACICANAASRWQ
jgi:hypothetical protein